LLSNAVSEQLYFKNFLGDRGAIAFAHSHTSDGNPLCKFLDPPLEWHVILALNGFTLPVVIFTAVLIGFVVASGIVTLVKTIYNFFL